MRAMRSIRILPTIPAWAAVPQAVMMIFLMRLASSGVRLSCGRRIRPASKSTRPARVSVSARTCSWISFCMKWRYSPFSAEIGSQATVVHLILTGFALQRLDLTHCA
jgi:hypothetical protein